MIRNYYEILDVKEDSDAETIKKSYRKLAMQYHPDRNPNDAVAEQKFKEIQEAYDTLGDESKRKQYDFSRNNQNSMFGFGDIFNDFVRRHEVDEGQNTQYQVFCSFEDSVVGVNKTVRVKTNETCVSCGGTGCRAGHQAHTCRNCQGKGRVVVQQMPAPGVMFKTEKFCDLCGGKGTTIDANSRCGDCDRGLRDSEIDLTFSVPPKSVFGTMMRIPNRGLLKKPNGKRGYCLITLMPEQHDLYKTAQEFVPIQKHAKSGLDLGFEYCLTLAETISGCIVDIPTLDGIVQIKIPPFASDNFVHIIRNAGIYTQERTRTNIIITARTELNRNLPDLGIMDTVKHSENEKTNPLAYNFKNKLSQQKERLKNGKK